MNKELVQFIFCGQREWIVMENNHLEDKIGRTFLTLTTVVFFWGGWDMSPKGKKTKAMINKLDTYLILRGFPGSSVVKNPPGKK